MGSALRDQADWQLGGVVPVCTFSTGLVSLLADAPVVNEGWIWKKRRYVAWLVLHQTEHDIVSVWVSRCENHDHLVTLAQEIRACYYPWDNSPRVQHAWLAEQWPAVAAASRQVLGLVGNESLLGSASLDCFPGLPAYVATVRAALVCITSIETETRAFEETPSTPTTILAWLAHLQTLGLQFRQSFCDLLRLLKGGT